MVTLKVYTKRRNQPGISLIEVLVTMSILAVGLLGLAKLQSYFQISEIEAYQRSQALVLLNDMANRIANNRSNAADYVTVSPLGYGMDCPTSTTTRQDSDTAEWCNALQGAGEAIGDNNVGALINGRGCVQSLGGNDYLVTVAWQGMGATAAPPATVTCGQGSYNGSDDSVCVDDLCRRAITTLVRIATL